MRVAVLAGPRKVELTTTDPAPLVAGSVHVRIDRCGIGGLDLETWVGGDPPAPAWFGHEWVGRVMAIGSGVSERFEGERVVGATTSPCGSCRPCQAGLGRACELALAMILGTDPLASPHGAFAEVIRVDARRVHRAPEGIDDDRAALTEPAAVAVHAVDRAEVRLGDIVAVVGTGTIGLLVVQFARLAGAIRVVAVDPDGRQRETACSIGADAAFATAADAERWLAAQGHGLGADVVVECAGSPVALDSSVAVARRGARVVVVGALADSGTNAPVGILAKELTIAASLGYTVADVHRALELMADDRLRTEELIDRVISLGELPSALARLAGTSAAGKMLVDPTAPAGGGSGQPG